jgi:hypothetical protein
MFDQCWTIVFIFLPVQTVWKLTAVSRQFERVSRSPQLAVKEWTLTPRNYRNVRPLRTCRALHLELDTEAQNFVELPKLDDYQANLKELFVGFRQFCAFPLDWRLTNVQRLVLSCSAKFGEVILQYAPWETLPNLSRLELVLDKKTLTSTGNLRLQPPLCLPRLQVLHVSNWELGRFAKSSFPNLEEVWFTRCLLEPQDLLDVSNAAAPDPRLRILGLIKCRFFDRKPEQYLRALSTLSFQTLALSPDICQEPVYAQIQQVCASAQVPISYSMRPTREKRAFDE